MKTKIIRKLIMIMLILGMTLLIFLTYKISKKEIFAVNTGLKNIGTLVSGEIAPEKYTYKIIENDIELKDSRKTPTYLPKFPDDNVNNEKYKGYQVYCVNRGVAFNNKNSVIYVSDERLNNEYDTYDKLGLVGYFTHSVYRPTKEKGDLSPAMAYVVSIVERDKNNNILKEWTIRKQIAIWDLRAEGLDGGIIDGEDRYLNWDEYTGTDKEDILADAEVYVTEAKNYNKYQEKVKDKGLEPKDNTNLNSVNLNLQNGEYTVGPFNISYTNGIYGKIAFSGISEITAVGYNVNNEIITDNIKVNKIILKDMATGRYGSAVDPQYFEPDKETKIDTNDQVYPKPGQDFKIVIEDPNKGIEDNSEKVVYISLKVKFKYMLTNGKYQRLEGKRYAIRCEKNQNGKYVYKLIYEGYTDNNGNDATYVLKQQGVASMDAIRSLYEEEVTTGKIGIIKTTSLGGYVWEDGTSGKEQKADGIRNTEGNSIDRPLKNIKVTVYTEDGKPATLITNPREQGISEAELMYRINPTYTDENGYYQFEGLEADKKYYVVFEYNGQKYLPTEYLNTQNGQYKSVEQMINAGLYGTEEWKSTSKGTEVTSTKLPGVDISRNEFNTRFEEIRSYPENYKTSNSLNKAGTYNIAYTQMDLMGYTLGEDGKYKQTGTQLIDGFAYDEKGLVTSTFTEGVISTKVRKYITDKKAFPSDTAMYGIYEEIVNESNEDKDELWSKLQFVEDCYIQSYTGSPFTQQKETYQTRDKSETGQYYINLGLWRRQEFDVALTKDLYKATLKINNKTVVYTYDKRNEADGGTNNSNGEDNNTTWDINVRMSDYNSYYGMNYNREIYESDYLFNTQGGIGEGHPGNPLEIYVTYKIAIRNQSMSVIGKIQEVVDYYDKDYTYRDDLSWITYDKNTVTDEQYYNAMVSGKVDKNENITNAKPVNSSNNSKYGPSTQSDIVGNKYNAVYINGLKDKKLASGEMAYIYLTFEVNKENNRVILDGGEYSSSDTPKENLVEVKGFSTYYKDGTELPNEVTKTSNDIAGLLDRDSNPGNLNKKDLEGEKYEKNFEDDTDRAPSLRVIIDEEAVRKANGTVWEDERTNKVGDAIIGDGIRQDEEIGVSGITVQLVEKCIDGSEYIWKETKSGADGKYNIESFIPGDYVIRFYYGDTKDSALTTEEQPVSYNGQDFKSTTYQAGIAQEGKTDSEGKYSAYIDTKTQNESGTYGYDINKADSNPVNYSDAKDIWSTASREGLKINGSINSAREVQGRQDVIDYSSTNVTNHKAEVLASPYQTPSYNGTEYTEAEMNELYKELMDETYMTAETGVIVVEFEYDRKESDGLKNTENSKNNSGNNITQDNRYNSHYELKNIDFGLTERPKSQLEIDKSVSNIKVTLANGSILFDINEAANNALWKDHKEYSIDEDKINENNQKIDFDNGEIGMYNEYYGKGNKHRYSYREEIDKIVKKTDKGLIQLTMDEELMHGATIQITYAVKVTNVGEVDYVDGEYKNFYYNGDNRQTHISKTTANQVIDYVQNNLQYDASNKVNTDNGWALIKVDDLLNGKLVNDKLETTNNNKLSSFNTIIQATSFKQALEPGEEISKALVLSQLITPENTEDDLTYGNMVEIVNTSNELGRRMAYSVVGNQDPTLEEPTEVDSNIAERIIILTPFGQVRIYYIVGILVAAILIGGIILIRKKVLKDKNK